MRKRLLTVMAAGVIFAFVPSAAFAQALSAEKRMSAKNVNVFNKITDYFATVGKSDNDKRMIKRNRINQRKQARLNSMNRKRSKNTKKKIRRQNKEVMQKIEASRKKKK